MRFYPYRLFEAKGADVRKIESLVNPLDPQQPGSAVQRVSYPDTDLCTFFAVTQRPAKIWRDPIATELGASVSDDIRLKPHYFVGALSVSSETLLLAVSGYPASGDATALAKEIAEVILGSPNRIFPYDVEPQTLDKLCENLDGRLMQLHGGEWIVRREGRPFKMRMTSVGMSDIREIDLFDTLELSTKDLRRAVIHYEFKAKVGREIVWQIDKSRKSVAFALRPAHERPPLNGEDYLALGAEALHYLDDQSGIHKQQMKLVEFPAAANTTT